jgi:hypothetical protein
MGPMSTIKEILQSGKSARTDQGQPIQEEDLKAAECSLHFTLPASYKEFIALGGLCELRINHRVLSPKEIIVNLRFVTEDKFIPFAENGCGDLYCWPRTTVKEPSVFFADHETGEYVANADSFSQWLAKNRF